ncbi:DUF402 domain-containing protein [Actinoplanes sp. TBRC 11911]|uniref:DUF402 domain-containing protein n=1 Tax=Actinoplanes sp. TBRC 11911 TaxID=2729386 RepID=UPI0020071514|nr:DUF402 domain-containing protein [Actinoplanes sp. TBRC 11911]
MPAGSEFAVLRDADGRRLHDTPLDEMRRPGLVRDVWHSNDILVLMPPDAGHSVWWFFTEGHFAGWYVNLEKPFTRTDAGVDTTDLVLDVWVEPDRSWQWKAEDEMAARIGRPHYFDGATAAGIRAEGERLIKLAEAGAYPFDGTHVDFRPDPAWTPLTLPSHFAALSRRGAETLTRRESDDE